MGMTTWPPGPRGTTNGSMTDLVDTPGAAVLVHRSARTLEAWRRTGYGPRYLRLRRMVLYRVADIQAWLDEQYEGAPGTANTVP